MARFKPCFGYQSGFLPLATGSIAMLVYISIMLAHLLGSVDPKSLVLDIVSGHRCQTMSG